MISLSAVPQSPESQRGELSDMEPFFTSPNDILDMVVLNALRRTPSALRRNPVLLVPILVILVLQIPQFALQAVNPLLSSLVSLGVSLVFLVVMPFFQGGLIAMADEALDGRTALQTFVDDGKSNYVSLLVAYLALIAVNFALGMVAFFVALFGGIFVMGSGGLESASITVLVAIGIVVALIVILYLLVLFFIQFYGQAIVIEEMGAVDGLKHSASVVRRHIVSTLGYSILVGILGGVFGGVFGVLSLLVSPQSAAAFPLPELSLPLVAGVGLLVLVAGTLFGGFFAVYSVSFYRELSSN